MNISFTGIKNISAVPCTEYPAVGIKPNGEPIFTKECYVKANTINVELDNNESNDLFEYNKVLKSSTIPEGKHPINPNFLNIATITSYPEPKKFYLFINDEQVTIEDKNLPLISFVTKLLKKVSNFKESDFHIEKDYILGDEAPQALTIGKDLRELEEDYLANLAFIHCADQVTEVSKEAFEEINDKMLDYFS